MSRRRRLVITLQDPSRSLRLGRDRSRRQSKGKGLNRSSFESPKITRELLSGRSGLLNNFQIFNLNFPFLSQPRGSSDLPVDQDSVSLAQPPLRPPSPVIKQDGRVIRSKRQRKVRKKRSLGNDLSVANDSLVGILKPRAKMRRPSPPPPQMVVAIVSLSC